VKSCLGGNGKVPVTAFAFISTPVEPIDLNFIGNVKPTVRADASGGPAGCFKKMAANSFIRELGS
jgi:hypothetical protein